MSDAASRYAFPRSSAKSLFKASRRALTAVVPPVVLSVKPKFDDVGEVGIASGRDLLPVMNRLTPAIDVTIGNVLPACGAITSASRPAQPVPELPRVTAGCHSVCWSECEYS